MIKKFTLSTFSKSSYSRLFSHINMGSCISTTPSKNKSSRGRLKTLKRWISKNASIYKGESDFAKSAPVFPDPNCLPEILEKVVGYLDFNSLKQFRLVSKEWNDEALRILAKRWFIWIEKTSTEWYKGIYVIRRESTRHLPRTLAKSQVPRYFFTNVTVPMYSIVEKKRIQKLLRKFGVHVKTLYLKGSYDRIGQPPLFDKIIDILISWCPNLTSLSLTIPTGQLQFPQDFQFIPFNPLENVTSLGLQGDGGGNPDSEEFAVFLIKSCPKLKSLRLSSPLRVFNKFSELPHITRNLSKFTWIDSRVYAERCACENLKFITSLKFSNKLRLRHLDLKLDVKLSDERCCLLLYKFLQTLSTHLEFLKISVVEFYCCCDYFPSDEELELLLTYRRRVHWNDVKAFVPEMNQLKVLILDANNVFGLDSFPFLKKCPNVVTFQLGQREIYRGSNGHRLGNLYQSNDVNNLQFNWAQTDPRVFLKELYIGDRDLPFEAFEALPKGFPNLSTLLISTWKSVDTIMLILQKVAELESLMDLTLEVRLSSTQKLLPLLPAFKNYKELRTLRVINSSVLCVFCDCDKPSEYPHPTCQVVWNALSALREMNCSFSFEFFPMIKKEEQMLLSTAKENGMRLSWYTKGRSREEMGYKTNSIL